MTSHFFTIRMAMRGTSLAQMRCCGWVRMVCLASRSTAYQRATTRRLEVRYAWTMRSASSSEMSMS
jgi:hypothetical protein